MNTIKQISLIFLVTILCLTTSILAQDRTSQQIKAKPIRIDKIPTDKLPIPEGVSIVGAKFYEFLIAPSGEVTINLYGDLNNRIASFVVQESLADKSFIYKIIEDNEESWVKTQSQRHEDSILYSAISSAGTEMNLDVQIEDSGKFGKTKVKGITLPLQKEVKTFYFNESNLSESRLAAQDVLQTEEQKFFTTPSLRKLKEFIQNFSFLKNAALSKWTGTDQKQSAPCKQKESGDSVEMLPGPCSGTALCMRIVTLTPLFSCSSTSCGWGIYIIEECGLNIICTQRCADLVPCA